MDETTQLSLATLEVEKLEAFFELMVLAAICDGELHSSERAAFDERVVAHVGPELSAPLVRAMLATALVASARDGVEARLARVRSRLPEQRLREAALALAAKVVRADGRVLSEESAFLEQVGRTLELDAAAMRAALAG
jgi:tellurite resistance protein